MKDFFKKLTPFCKVYWPFLFLAVVVLLFFWKVFLGLIPFPGDFVVGIYYPWLDYNWGFPAGVPVKNPILADVPSFIYPMQTFAMELLKSGQWPLWNPYILGGAPLLANFQSAPFSITAIFYFIFSKINAWTLQIIFQHLLASFFTYILLRHWSLSKAASIFGATVFAFSGFNMVWSGWNGHTLGAAYIPLLLYFQDRLLSNKGKLNGVGLSVVFCLQILSGYPQTIIYTAVACLLLWLVHLRVNRLFFKKTTTLGFYFLLGLGLSSIQLLPSIRLLGLSQWTAEPHPFEWAFLPFVKTITFVAPDFFGSHTTGNYWGPQDYTSNTGFSGVVAFVFTFITLANYKVRKYKYITYSSVLAAVTLLLVYPTPISIFAWKWDILGMRSSSAHRGLVLLNLGVSLLMAFGIDIYLKEKKTKVGVASGLIAAILALYFSLSLYLLKTNPNSLIFDVNKYWVGIRNLVFPSAIFTATIGGLYVGQKLNMRKVALTIVYFIMLGELFRFGWKFTSFSKPEFVYPTTPAIEFLQNQSKPFRVSLGDTMPVNLHMPYNLETLGGYETMRPQKASSFIASVNKNSADASPAGRYGIIDNDSSPLLALVNTRYYLTLKRNIRGGVDENGVVPQKFQNSRFKKVFEDKSVVVLEATDVLPRAYMFYDWEIKKDKEALELLLNEDFNFHKKVVLEEDPMLEKGSGVENKVEFLYYGPQKSEIDVETKKAGVLFISNNNYPGWKAWLDNERTEILPANYTFQAIIVPEGEHKLTLEYSPDLINKAMLLSLFSAFIVVTIIFRSVILDLNES